MDSRRLVWNMPGSRSYIVSLHAGAPLSWAQQKRQRRNRYYLSAHSAPDKAFVEVDRGIRSEAKATLKGTALHVSLAAASGSQAASGKVVAHHAWKNGTITASQRNLARNVFSAADTAKHELSSTFSPVCELTALSLCLGLALLKPTPLSRLRRCTSYRFPDHLLRARAGQTRTKTRVTTTNLTKMLGSGRWTSIFLLPPLLSALLSVCGVLAFQPALLARRCAEVAPPMKHRPAVCGEANPGKIF